MDIQLFIHCSGDVTLCFGTDKSIGPQFVLQYAWSDEWLGKCTKAWNGLKLSKAQYRPREAVAAKYLTTWSAES